MIIAGHDVASGGLITTLLELCFAENNLGASIDLTAFVEKDLIKILFAENAGIVFQAAKNTDVESILTENNIAFFNIGTTSETADIEIKKDSIEIGLNISSLRRKWFQTSYLLDQQQTAKGLAGARFANFDVQPLTYSFPKQFPGI